MFGFKRVACGMVFYVKGSAFESHPRCQLWSPSFSGKKLYQIQALRVIIPTWHTKKCYKQHHLHEILRSEGGLLIVGGHKWQLHVGIVYPQVSLPFPFENMFKKPLGHWVQSFAERRGQCLPKAWLLERRTSGWAVGGAWTVTTLHAVFPR